MLAITMVAHDKDRPHPNPPPLPPGGGDNQKTLKPTRIDRHMGPWDTTSIPRRPTEEGRKMADVKIEIRANGPNRISGPIDIVDQDGNNYAIPEGRWVALCRCGQSATKPFCDGGHRDAGFEAESKAF